MDFLAEEHWSDSGRTMRHKMPPPKGPLRDKKSPVVPVDEGKMFILKSLSTLVTF